LTVSEATPAEAAAVVKKAGDKWLKNTEVVDILNHYSQYGFPVSTEAPATPTGGTLFLFHRKQVRFFRKDGHNWRKKPDGKTVRETHEKLKVDNQDILNCYYAHAEEPDGEFQLQRRCYWLLEGDINIVLVHYLKIPAEALRAKTERHDDPYYYDMVNNDAVVAMNRLRMDGVSGSQMGGQMDPTNMVSWQHSNQHHTHHGVPGSTVNFGRDTVGISGYGEIEPTLLNQMDQYGNWTGPVAHSVAPHPGQRPPYMPRQQDGPSGQGGSTPGTGNWHQAHAMVHEAHARQAHAQAQAHQAQAQAHAQAQARGRIETGYSYGMQDYNSPQNAASLDLHAQSFEPMHGGTSYGPPSHYGMGGRMQSNGMPRDWQPRMVDQSVMPNMQPGNPMHLQPETDNGTYEFWQRQRHGQQQELSPQSQRQVDTMRMRAHQQAMHADQQQQGPVYFDQQNAQQCSPVYSSDNPSLHVRGSEPGREGSPMSNKQDINSMKPSPKPNFMKDRAYCGSEAASSYCKICFHIGDFSPDWDYTTGGGKILVTGSLENLEAGASLSIMFGDTQVPAEHLQPGVLRCQTPPNPPGVVPMCVTRGDGQPCSLSVEFHYNLPIKDPPSNLISSITTETSSRELQVRLVTRLLKETGGSLTGDESETQANMGAEDHKKLVDSAMARVCALEAEHAERVLELLLERELKIFTQQIIETHNPQQQVPPYYRLRKCTGNRAHCVCFTC